MNKNKERDFENATQSLIRQIDSMNLEKTERLQVKNFILLFRDSFKQDSVKHATFAPVLGDGYKQFLCDSCGFCKASSVSFVSFMNTIDVSNIFPLATSVSKFSLFFK